MNERVTRRKDAVQSTYIHAKDTGNQRSNSNTHGQDGDLIVTLGSVTTERKDTRTFRSSVSNALRLESKINSTNSWVDWTFD